MALGAVGWKGLEASGSFQLPHSTQAACPPPALSHCVALLSDVPMQQNMALFEFNGQCGYLLKHEFMRRPDKQFDPFSVDRIDGLVATTVCVTASAAQGPCPVSPRGTLSATWTCGVWGKALLWQLPGLSLF